MTATAVKIDAYDGSCMPMVLFAAVIRIPRARDRRARRRLILLTVAVIAVIAIVLGALSTFYTELLWFHETGYTPVFWASVWSRVFLGVVFGALFSLLLLLNLWIVRKITNPARLFSVPDQILERYRATLQPYIKWAIVAAALAFGFFAGSGASVKWREWLLFRHPSKFGPPFDPVFHKDIGFYVFKLPFERFVFTWLFSTLLVVTIIAGIAHYFMGGIRPQQAGERVAPEVRAHLSALLGLILLLKAWGYRLDQFNLLYSSRGQVTGAAYTDVHAQLPALKLLVVIAIVVSVFFFVNARVKNWILPAGGIGLLFLTSLVAGGIYPAATQRLRVAPNERIQERLYIQRNIEATRVAYGINKVQVVQYSGTSPLQPAAVQRNASTVENIRLWDPSVLVNQYTSLQRIKQYYEFLDVDIDRYPFPGGERQVMLSAREIFPQGLSPEAKTWLNTHLVYTHGYGVVASRVDRVTQEGQPDFIIQGVPPASEAGAPKITQPRIYFAEHQETPFVIVNSKQPELDYPQGDEFAQSNYDGTGGIRLGSFLRRAAFAWRFRDVNLFISGAITKQSRIMFRRVISDRVQRVAPFIHLDSDPYIAIIDGRLQWILDGYTTTAMFPYSQRINFGAVSANAVTGVGNYIRNSVKFVVDAKNGTMDAYAWDPSDPILRSWMKIFPRMFKPRSAISPSLLRHIRYPEGMFKLQSDRYSNYHITNADNFYSKEDAWLVANDPTNAGTPIPPYYVLMKLPDERGLDFVLVRPFTPVGRLNMTGYMVAHSDPEDYGKLVTYAFPKNLATFGPEQVEARINQDTLVAQQITLWNQQNSKIIYGNLLIVPIQQSLLYVQPLYLQGQGATIPELKRVVAVAGGTVKMGDTLDQALAAIFGQAPASPIEGVAPSGKSVRDLIADALLHDQRAQAALRAGDFATYGREQALVRKDLEEAAKASGASPTPSPSR